MNKRIVIMDYSLKGKTIFQIAINTRQGTMLESSVKVRTILQAYALVKGYLDIFQGEIEIHPGSIDEWHYLRCEMARA